MPSTTSTITLKVDDPAMRDQQLEQATALLRENAAGCGVLVTRFDHTTFTVALSADIEFGLIRGMDML
jgi:hypothetical protein